MKQLWIILLLVVNIGNVYAQKTIVKRKAVRNNKVQVVKKVSSIALKRDEVINRLLNNMVYVKGGSFFMGNENDRGGFLSAQNVHMVSLADFYICKYEVSQEEWNAIMGKNPSCFKGEKRPVESVSWFLCQVFLSRLNEITGKYFRLPTEAEWEYAARGGIYSKGYKYSGGNNAALCAWLEREKSQTQNVGLKRPNELGLYDMSGNVSEFCLDWYAAYEDRSVANPGGPQTGNARIVRGGGWDQDEFQCTVWKRACCEPDFSGNNSLGFRVVMVCK